MKAAILNSYNKNGCDLEIRDSSLDVPSDTLVFVLLVPSWVSLVFWVRDQEPVLINRELPALRIHKGRGKYEGRLTAVSRGSSADRFFCLFSVFTGIFSSGKAGIEEDTLFFFGRTKA